MNTGCALSLTTEFAAIKESLVDERQSTCRSTSARAEAATIQYQMLLRFYREQGGQDAIRPEIARRALAKSAWAAGCALRNEGFLSDANDMFTTSLEHHHTFRAAWAQLRLRCKRLFHAPSPGTL